jgi:regulator of sigma E protease
MVPCRGRRTRVSIGDLFSGGAAILVTLAILFVLVLVHEFGHFVVARRFGVRVHEFGIGFPPRARILGRDKETIYTLNWLPLGGFVRLEGEDGGDRNDPRSFASQSLWRRVVILAAGVAMNLVLAIVIFTVIALAADPSVSLRFTSASPGTLAANLGLAPGDTLEAVDGRRFSYFDQEFPTSALLGRSDSATLTVRLPDGTEQDRTVELGGGGGIRIAMVLDGSPAAAVGLQAGEVILSIDGRPVSFLHAADVSTYLREHAGQRVTLTVQRGLNEVALTPTLRPASEIGPDKGALGVRFDPGNLVAEPGPPIRHDPATAVQKGFARTGQALGLVLGALGTLVGSVATDPTQAPPVSGPVGIVFTVGALLQSYPPVFILWMSGLLSANLALINILPLPPLDGGRIAVSVLQAALGKRISGSIERFAYFFGFVLLIAFILWVTYFDVLRGPQLAP